MRNIGYIVLIVIVAAIIIALPSNGSKTEPEKKVMIELNGQENINILVGSTYEDEGFTLKLADEIIPQEAITYQKADNINPEVVGDYKVEYSLEYEGKIYELERTVSVIDDIPPVITVNNEVIELYKCKKTEKNNLNYIATDNYDGVITENVKEEVLENTIRLSVSDSSNNFTSVEIPYVLADDVKLLKLEGTDIVYTKKGNEYQDFGVKVYNSCDKEIELAVEVTNNVNTEEIGEYSVVYELKIEDKIITTERKVVVYEEVARLTNPEIAAEKIVYLTFDDGPGRYTQDILDILDKYNAKATFFITNQFKDYLPLIKDEYARGHTVAIHTSTHKWSIYRSLENYLRDFYEVDKTIYEYTGVHSKLFRFPGGASNAISESFSDGVVSAISSHLSKRGYISYDWNVDSSDAAGANKETVVKNVIEGINEKKVSVVLLHDIKKATRDGLEEILQYGQENGYQFLALDETSPTIHHGIRN